MNTDRHSLLAPLIAGILALVFLRACDTQASIRVERDLRFNNPHLNIGSTEPRAAISRMADMLIPGSVAAPRYVLASASDDLLLRPRGGDAAEAQILKMGPVAVWTLDDFPYTSGVNAGVVADKTGRYPGTISGTYYYSQVVVSGTLSPDAHGTYTVGGMYGGYPYYAIGTSYYLWVGSGFWHITITLGTNTTNRWYSNTLIFSSGFYAAGSATGTPTVANVPASGVYLFVPSGVTLQSAGPTLAGEKVTCAAFTTGNVAIGASVLDPSGAFSFSAWVNATSVSGSTEQVIFGCALSSTKRFTVSIKSSVLQSGYNNGTTSYACSGTALTGWHHIAACKATGNSAPVLYIDGVAQSGTTAPTFASTNNSLIGARNDATLPIAGSLAYPVIWSRALSAAEVKELAACQP